MTLEAIPDAAGQAWGQALPLAEEGDARLDGPPPRPALRAFAANLHADAPGGWAYGRRLKRKPREEPHERADQGAGRSGGDEGEIADAAEIRERRGGAAASQAEARGGVSAVLEIRLRQGGRRPYHRARSRVPRHVLGQPVWRAFQPDQGVEPHTLRPQGERGRGRLSRQHGRLRHSFARSRRAAGRSRRRPLAFDLWESLFDAGAAARADHPGRLRLLQRPRGLRRLRRRRGRARRRPAHRRRDRQDEGRNPPEPRPHHGRRKRRQGGLVVHHDGAVVPGAAHRRGGAARRRDAQTHFADGRGANLCDHRQRLRRLVPVPAALRAHRQGKKPDLLE